MELKSMCGYTPTPCFEVRVELENFLGLGGMYDSVIICCVNMYICNLDIEVGQSYASAISAISLRIFLQALEWLLK